MNKQIIPQDSTIKPIVETHYICPVKGCDRDLGAVTYGEALAHVNQKGFELPIGLVLGAFFRGVPKAGIEPRDFWHYNKIGLMDELDEGHNPVYNTIYFDADLAKISKEQGSTILYRAGNLTAKDLIEGDLSLLTEKEFDVYLGLVEVAKGFEELRSLVPIRTTPELEEIIARMRKENKR